MLPRPPLALVPLSTRTAYRRTTLHPLTRPLTSPLLLGNSGRRWYADKKKEDHGKPGHAHSSVKDMADSAKSEIKDARHTLADTIAGGHAARMLGGLEGKLADMAYPLKIPQHVPKEAWYFGAAGLIPYLSTSLASIYLARQASLAKASELTARIDFDTADALLYHVQNVQLTYGAIILSFVGAIHWGFEFAGYGGRQGAKRYVIGLLPMALAWPSLLLQPAQGLTVQLGAFFLAWYTDNRTTSWGWSPRWYSTYRFGLTAVVGSTIMLSLVGASYFDPKLKVMGIGESALRQHAEMKQRSAKVTDTRSETTLERADSTIEESDEDSEYYLRLRDFAAEREEREKEEAKEREEQEKKEQEEEQEKKERQNEKKTAEAAE